MAKGSSTPFYDVQKVAEVISDASVSQSELAKQHGIHKITVTRVKSGIASVSTLATILDALGFDYRQFLLPASEMKKTHSVNISC